MAGCCRRARCASRGRSACRRGWRRNRAAARAAARRPAAACRQAARSAWRPDAWRSKRKAASAAGEARRRSRRRSDWPRGCGVASALHSQTGGGLMAWAASRASLSQAIWYSVPVMLASLARNTANKTLIRLAAGGVHDAGDEQCPSADNVNAGSILAGSDPPSMSVKSADRHQAGGGRQKQQGRRIPWRKKAPERVSKCRRKCARWRKKAWNRPNRPLKACIAATQHAVATAGTQVTSMQTGAKETGELAMRFAERNVASSFEFAEKLVRAKDAAGGDGAARRYA